FAAVELQDVERRCRHGGGDRRIIRIDEEPDAPWSGEPPLWYRGAERRRALRRHVARARRVEDEAEEIGAAGDRGDHRLGRREAADLDRNAGLSAHARARSKASW